MKFHNQNEYTTITCFPRLHFAACFHTSIGSDHFGSLAVVEKRERGKGCDIFSCLYLSLFSAEFAETNILIGFVLLAMGICLSARIKAESPANTGNYDLFLRLFCMVFGANICIYVRVYICLCVCVCVCNHREFIGLTEVSTP